METTVSDQETRLGDYDAQALSKIQRGHAQDLADVREMLDRGLIDREELYRRFDQIEPHLYRYPAVDPEAFRKALREALERPDSSMLGT